MSNYAILRLQALDLENKREKIASSNVCGGNDRKVKTVKKVIPRHHAIGLNAMFKAIKLPGGIANLNPGLTYRLYACL